MSLSIGPVASLLFERPTTLVWLVKATLFFKTHDRSPIVEDAMCSTDKMFTVQSIHTQENLLAIVPKLIMHNVMHGLA